MVIIFKTAEYLDSLNVKHIFAYIRRQDGEKFNAWLVCCDNVTSIHKKVGTTFMFREELKSYLDMHNLTLISK